MYMISTIDEMNLK